MTIRVPQQLSIMVADLTRSPIPQSKTILVLAVIQDRHLIHNHIHSCVKRLLHWRVASTTAS
jgi:hypothetical protein